MGSEIDVQKRYLEPLKDARLEDLEAIGALLEVTDPDPYANKSTITDLEDHLSRFKSVTQFVPKSSAGLFDSVKSAGRETLTFLADSWSAEYQKLSSEALLTLLETLEKEAFEYDPKTKSGVIKDKKAFVQLKNTILAIERLGFKDPKFLEKVDAPDSAVREKIYYCSILVKPELTEEVRGEIFRMERGELTAFEALEKGRGEYVSFLENYDGKAPFMDLPLWRGGILIGEYMNNRFSKEEVFQANQKLTRKYYKEDQKRFVKMGIARKELDNWSKAKTDSIVWTLFQILQILAVSEDPQVKIMTTGLFCALNYELNLRGKSFDLLYKKNLMVRLVLFRNFKSRYSKNVEQLLDAADKAVSTASRLDNYRSRDTFLKGTGLIFEKEFSRKGSWLYQDQNDESFSLFVSNFVSFARNSNIPFKTEDLFEIAAQARMNAGIVKFNENKKVTWDDIPPKGEITIPFESYPRNEDPWEDDISLAHQIEYNGVSLYDMAMAAIDTVTFKGEIGEEGGFRTIGLARGLFRDIVMEAYDSRFLIELRPVYKRLDTLAHEAFHNLESLRSLQRYQTGGEDIMLFRERGAYLFGAHVTEEYLKLRIKAHKRGEKELSAEEEKKILELIVDNRLNGLMANYRISQLYPGTFEKENLDPEIPLIQEHQMAQRMERNIDDQNLAMFSRGEEGWKSLIEEGLFYSDAVENLRRDYISGLGMYVMKREDEIGEVGGISYSDRAYKKGMETLIEIERERIYKSLDNE